MKKLLILLLVTVMCSAVCVNASATTTGAVTPLWTNIYRMSNTLTFSGTDGEASGSVYGKAGTTAINGTMTVYRQVGSVWIYVTSTSDSTSAAKLSLTCNFSAVSGAYYKSVFEVTVTVNGVNESETKTSYKSCT